MILVLVGGLRFLTNRMWCCVAAVRIKKICIGTERIRFKRQKLRFLLHCCMLCCFHSSLANWKRVIVFRVSDTKCIKTENLKFI